MKQFSLLFLLILSTSTFSQTEKRPKQVMNFWDYNRTILESKGGYYVDDFLGETTLKHGKWSYYNQQGILEEEHMYVKGVLNGPVITYYISGKKSAKGFFKNNMMDSVYFEWHENGQIKVQGQYKNDRPIGKWTHFYKNGFHKMEEDIVDSTNYVMSFWKMDSTQTVIDGNGRTFIYYESTGYLQEFFTYKDGLKNGDFEEYTVRGQPFVIGEYVANKKHGEWLFYYYLGTIDRKVNYNMGQLEGEYLKYYDNGKLNVRGAYQNGLKSGDWTWYTNYGSKDMQGSFVDGKQDGLWTYWNGKDSTKISSVGYYKSDMRHGNWEFFYPNGKKWKAGTYENDLQEGEWITWFENGKILQKGPYIAGKENGPWEQYYDNGKIKNEAVFTDGKLNGEWKSFHKNGKPMLTGNYENDLKSGEWVRYSDKGKLLEIGSYKIVNTKKSVKYGPFAKHEVPQSLKDGHWIWYSEKDGGKTHEGDYKNGKEEGEWIYYFPGGAKANRILNYKNGKLDGKMIMFQWRPYRVTTEIDYKDGLKHGKMFIYDKNNKVIVEKTFEEGIELGPDGKPKAFVP